MKTSVSGRAAIEQREGRRLSAYCDSRGILTIGVGHTGRMSPPAVAADMTVTEAECDAMLATDLAPVEAVIRTAVKVPISQNEFDALASLGFNIGAAGLRKSTVIKRLNIGDVRGAADAIMNWSKPVVLAGRRKAERQQFLTPDPPDDIGVRQGQQVAAARSAALSTRAAHFRAQSKASVVGGTVAIAAGSAATASAAAAGASYWAWIIACIFTAGAALDGFVIVMHARTAATLSANGAAQRTQANGLGQNSDTAEG